MAVVEFRRRFPDRASESPVVARAPGRINLLGEHTDYNQGYVLPAATEQATYVAAAPRSDRRLRVWTTAFEASDEFDVDSLALTRNSPRWSGYVRGVVWSLLEAGVNVPGADLAVVGDLPIGAGVASSASFEVALSVALLSLAGARQEPEVLALNCQRAENEFVGVRCGILDQSASVFGQEGCALLIDCRSLDIQPIPLGSQDIAFVVCDTRKPRGLVESEYNARRGQCEWASQVLRVPALRDASLEDLHAHREDLGEEAFRRARHVIAENLRVLQGAQALRRGDFAQMGALMTQAHASLRDDYNVSCRELDLMVQIAGETSGCLGARLMGAGFGGSALALVEAHKAGAFCDEVRSRYCAATQLDGRTLITGPSRGAGVVVCSEA